MIVAHVSTTRGMSHNNMVFVLVPTFWGAFSAKFSVAIGGFIRDEGAQIT